MAAVNRIDINKIAKLVPPFVVRDIAPVDLLAWLESVSIIGGGLLSRPWPRVYWRSRDNSFEVAGIGAAFDFSSEMAATYSEQLDQIEKLLNTHPDGENMVFIGGSKFNPDENTDELWEGFPKFRFVHPEVMIVRIGAAYRMVLATSTISPEQVISSLEIPEPEQQDHPVLISRSDSPDFTKWSDNIEKLATVFGDGTLKKVVLARRTDLSSHQPVNFYNLLSKLQAARQQCYHHLISPSEGVAFIGASPECLFRLDGSSLKGDSLGGTTWRRSGFELGDFLANELLNSGKNLAEHAFVTQDLLEKFNSLAKSVVALEQPSVVSLADVQHLFTHIAGTLNEGTPLHQILNTLHPTPAVCGSPCVAAMDVISRYEQFSRGWYAGPVGIIMKGRIEFAVALRSMIIRDRKASLFTGAGIVSGSSAEDEYQEIEHKMSTSLRLFSHSRIAS